MFATSKLSPPGSFLSWPDFGSIYRWLAKIRFNDRERLSEEIVLWRPLFVRYSWRTAEKNIIQAKDRGFPASTLMTRLYLNTTAVAHRPYPFTAHEDHPSPTCTILERRRGATCGVGQMSSPMHTPRRTLNMHIILHPTRLELDCLHSDYNFN